jgi:hypothetical protein
VVGEVLGDDAGEHDPGAAADAEQRGDEADRSGNPPGRELVADDREGEREDAPPTPWIARPRSITESEEATAAISVPKASRTSTMISNRSLPYMSPRRPMIGVVTEALSRNAVSTQPTALSVVFRESWIWGRAGTTRDCSRA